MSKKKKKLLKFLTRNNISKTETLVKLNALECEWRNNSEFQKSVLYCMYNYAWNTIICHLLNIGTMLTYRKASSRGAYGHDPFWSVFEEYPLESTRSDSTSGGARGVAGGAVAPPPPPHMFCFCFLLVISVGHGHDSTPTPLRLCVEIFLKSGGKMCRSPPPPPAERLFQGWR